MKILKNVLYAILFLIGGILIAALFISRDVVYEQSVIIEAPLEVVWEQTNSLADLEEWSPWNAYDPDMKKEWSGEADGTIGATIHWDSDHEKVGKGDQTIAKIEAPNYFETDLKFYDPYESEAKGYVALKEDGINTIATWGFSSVMPYPMNLMKLMYNMEEMMQDDFRTGLANLKSLCEKRYDIIKQAEAIVEAQNDQ